MQCQFSYQLVLKIHFKGIIDLVEMKAYFYGMIMGKIVEEGPIPEDMKDLVEEYRALLLKMLQNKMKS